MTPLERAARALAAQHHQPQFDAGNSSLLGHQYAERYWRDYTRQARAVLEAIREPGEALVNAGIAASQHDFEVTHAGMKRAYAAMIDAALAEETR